MENLFVRLSHNMTDFAQTVFRIVQRVDYERLNQYVIEIAMMRDLEGILHKTSACLSDILNYRIFGFAIRHGEAFDAWVDPSSLEHPFRRMIEKDFDNPRNVTIHPMKADLALVGYYSPNSVEGGLKAFNLAGEGYSAKLYLLPGKIYAHHENIMGSILKTLHVALSNYMHVQTLRTEAAFDQLTGCFNRHEFNRLIEHSVGNANRHNRKLAVVIFDIDHFKTVNDTYGHQAGDTVLKEIARIVRNSVRQGDYVVRYGGEEFIVLLPDTPLSRGIELAERLRTLMEKHEIELFDGRRVKVTASFGVAGLTREPDGAQRLVREADEMLYRAKAMGRNRVMPALKLHASPEKAEGAA
ncbi:MAG: GGDEF domain-containing protein [Acidobacteriota bacterium]